MSQQTRTATRLGLRLANSTDLGFRLLNRKRTRTANRTHSRMANLTAKVKNLAIEKPKRLDLDL